MGEAMRRYERRAERLCGELARLNHDHWAGLEVEGAAAAAYRRHRRLLSARVAERLRAAARDGDPERARRARALLEFVVESRVGESRLAADARVAHSRATALVRCRGRSLPLGSVAGALAAEPDRDRRLEVWHARERLVEARLTPDLVAARRCEAGALESLGYGSARAAFEDLSGIDLSALAAGCRGFIAAGEATLRAGLADLLGSVAVPERGAHAADLAWALAAVWREQAPEWIDLRDLHRRSLEALALDPLAGGHISLDLERRPGKSARGFCAAVRIPTDVRVVIAPAGGWADVPALLHEAGHAMHRAHTAARLDVPARVLGDRSVTESWAFLFEGICAEPGWFRSRLGVEIAQPLASALRLRQLLMVRRHCARLLFELELDAAGRGVDPVAMRARYRELEGGAVGAECGGAGWLADLDPWFHSARYLRGWMLAASWRASLVDRFGPAWFEQPAAGRWLRGVWAQGQRLGAAELLAESLGDRLGFGPLERELLEPRTAPAGAGATG